jgi:hypothetical protein
MERKYGKNYTVIGIYGDNQQVWMRHVEKASTPRAAAKKAIELTYDNGENGVEMEDIFVMDVFEGKVQGILGNSYVLSLKDLKKKGPLQ